MSYKKKTKKIKRVVDVAIVHVKSTFNNTIACVTDIEGNVLLRCSAGRLGYKGARKATPFVASHIGSTLAKDMVGLGIKRVASFKLQGPGAGKDNLVRSVQASGIEVNEIAEVTPLPHNGCRSPKKRRV